MARKDVSDLMVCRAVAIALLPRVRRVGLLLADLSGEPEKVCLRAVQRAHRHGLITVSSVWWPKLTEKGKRLLADCAVRECPRCRYRTTGRHLRLHVIDCPRCHRSPAAAFHRVA